MAGIIAIVLWDSGSKKEYRAGYQGAYDLQVQEGSVNGAEENSGILTLLSEDYLAHHYPFYFEKTVVDDAASLEIRSVNTEKRSSLVVNMSNATDVEVKGINMQSETFMDEKSVNEDNNQRSCLLCDEPAFCYPPCYTHRGSLIVMCSSCHSKIKCSNCLNMEPIK